MGDARRHWQLKSQGAANMVFAYCGDDPHLHGHVLRVRKSSAHTGTALDRALWEGVLHTANGCNIEYELEYMTHVVAPMLGRQYVFPGIPVPIPEELREAVGADTEGGTSLPALVQPDHTTFQCKVAPGYVLVGPAICLEIKPKWGLDPSEVHRRQQYSKPLNTLAAAAAAAVESPHAAGAPTPPAAPNGRSDLGRCCTDSDETVAQVNGVDELQAEIRKRYPRFMLHMLYKHVEKGLPVTLYNPLDLFSREKERMEAALWALIKCPSNNLSVFKDGAKIFGGNAKYEEGNSGPDGKGSVSPVGPLERLASDLEGFVVPSQDREDRERLAAGAEPGPGTAASTSAPAAGGSCAAAEPPPPLPSSSDGAQVPGQHTQQQEEEEQRHCHADSREALGMLVRVAALVLRQEAGLLEALHRVQALDDLGAERAVQVYEQLLYDLESGCEDGSRTRSAPALAGAAAGAAADLACGLLGAPSGGEEATGLPYDRAAALRRYLLSATAKDCGIMVTLQRAVPAASPSEAAVPQLQQSEAEVDAASAAAAVRPPHGPWVRLVTDPVTGATYAYKVALVDLDVKAAAKIPHHLKLERSLLKCAVANLAALEDMARRAGWPVPARTPTPKQ